MSRLYLFLFVVIISFSSCISTHRFINATVSPNITYITERGESQITTSYSTGGSEGLKGRNNGYDLQAGYAVAENLVLIGSFHHKNELDTKLSRPNEKFDSVNVNYIRNIYELGAAYVIPFDSRKIGSFTIAAGYHHDKNDWTETGTGESAGYQRFFDGSKSGLFLQPSFNYKSPNGIIKISWYFKGDFLKLRSPKTDFTAEEKAYYNFNAMVNSTIGYWSAGTDIRFRIARQPWLYAGFTGNLPFPMIDRMKIEETNFYSRNANFSFGLTFFPGAKRN